MTGVRRVSCIGVLFVLLFLLSSCSPKEPSPKVDLSSVPKPVYYDPVFGTWSAADSIPQKTILYPNWKFECYAKATDTKPSSEGTFEVVQRVADSNGTVYSMNVTNGSTGASLLHALWRLSDDRNQLEMIDVPVKSLSQKTWPKTFEPSSASYRRYLREKSGT